MAVKASPRPVDLPTLAGQYGIAPLYHAVLDSVPKTLGRLLHNVLPSELHAHLSTLQAHFTFVPVDEFVAARERAGLACLSFDDGHKSVIDTALPILADLGIPATIFVNSASFERPHLWRDKVRWLIEHDRIDDFERYMVHTRAVRGRSFYRYSKDPINSSLQVETEIDRFLEENQLSLSTPASCFDDAAWLVRHELLSYGNHTRSHYVLSSLTAQQQYEEIRATRDFLRRQDDIRLSNVFAVPFGGSRDFDRDTVSAVAELGYRGIVLSRGRLNTSAGCTRGLAVAERFMPRGPEIVDSVLKAFRNNPQ